MLEDLGGEHEVGRPGRDGDRPICSDLEIGLRVPRQVDADVVDAVWHELDVRAVGAPVVNDCRPPCKPRLQDQLAHCTIKSAVGVSEL